MSTVRAGKFYSYEVTFKYSWDKMAQALWKRYPNPHSRHVLTEDTYWRTSNNDNQLVTRRIITKTNPIPKWAEKALGYDTKAVFIEESLVDRNTKMFVTYNHNITQNKFLSMTEKCTYTVSPINSNWTCCLKQVWIQCGVYGVSKVVEKLGIERYKSNARKAELGLNLVLDKLFNTAHHVIQTFQEKSNL